MAVSAEKKIDMTFEFLVSSVADDLSRLDGPIGVSRFVAGYFPHDMEAGSLLMMTFDAKLLRGQLSSNLVEFEGYISEIVDNTCPVRH